MLDSQSERRLLWALLAFAAAIRFFFFLISVNGAGADAAPRALVAAEWSKHPVVVTSGHWLPLQIWLSGTFLWIWNDLWLAPRVISLIFGIATIWPLMRFVREFFSLEVTVATGLLFALYGLHIYQSVVSGGEALYFFFVFWALYHLARWWNAPQQPSLVWAGLLWIPATLTRHEAWWLGAGCTVIVLARCLATQRNVFAPVLTFGALAAAGPILWMLTCAATHGDALLTFHRTKGGIAYFQRSPLYKAAFWPVGLTLSLGPVALASAGYGLGVTLKKRRHLLLPALILAYGVPFWTLQLLGLTGVNIRHTLFIGMLLLPFAAVSFEGRFHRPGTLSRVALFAGVAWLVLVFALGETRWGEISQKFASISPRAKERWHVMAVTDWVRKHAGEDDRVVVDHYDDEESSLQFHVHLPPEHVRIYWGPKQSMDQVLAPSPRFIIYAKDGALAKTLQLDWNAPLQTRDGRQFTRRYANDVYAVFELAPPAAS